MLVGLCLLHHNHFRRRWNSSDLGGNLQAAPTIGDRFPTTAVMYAAQTERVHHAPPPPLSMDRLPAPRSAPYATPSSSTAANTITNMPRSPNVQLHTNTLQKGRIYRYDNNWQTVGAAELTNCFDSLEVVQQPIRARMCGFGDKVCSLNCRNRGWGQLRQR